MLNDDETYNRINSYLFYSQIKSFSRTHKTRNNIASWRLLWSQSIPKKGARLCGGPTHGLRMESGRKVQQNCNKLGDPILSRDIYTIKKEGFGPLLKNPNAPDFPKSLFGV